MIAGAIGQAGGRDWPTGEFLLITEADESNKVHMPRGKHTNRALVEMAWWRGHGVGKDLSGLARARRGEEGGKRAEVGGGKGGGGGGVGAERKKEEA